MFRKVLYCLFVACVYCTSLQAQFVVKNNLQYREVLYDVFIIKVDSSLENKFTIIENSTLQPELVFFDSITNNSPSLFFAITASIVDKDCQPLGLFIADGNEIKDINLQSGNGNFFLKPNGYLAWNVTQKVTVQDAAAYKKNADDKMAIQSGPMLVIDNVINKAFNPDSRNKYIRCGVGIYTEKGETFLVFARSVQPVSFYQIAQLFFEKFHCTDALNLESGENCSMHLPIGKTTLNQNTQVCRYVIINL